MNLTRLIVHCSATPATMDIGLAEIDAWHKANGWESPTGVHCGYHYIIRRSGKVELGRPQWEQGAHAKHANHASLGICLAGGVDQHGKPQDNYTDEQMTALRTLIETIIIDHGDLDVLGHRDLPRVAKSCPCFDVRAWWQGGWRKEPADLPQEPWTPNPIIADWL